MKFTYNSIIIGVISIRCVHTKQNNNSVYTQVKLKYTFRIISKSNGRRDQQASADIFVII